MQSIHRSGQRSVNALSAWRQCRVPSFCQLRALAFAVPFPRWLARARECARIIALCAGVWCLPQSARAGELVLAVSRNPISLAIFVAEDRGYFAAQGLKLKTLNCFPGKQCLQLMLDGKAQFATVAETPIVAASLTRSDFVILATIASSSNDTKLIARKSSGISTANDLVGKRVAVAKGTSAEYFLDSFLLFRGVDPSTVKVINKNADDLLAAVRSGEVDAVAAFEPSAYQTIMAMGSDFVILKNPRIYTTTFNLVAARGLVGGGDADMVKVLRAIKRGNDFIHDHKAEAQAILKARFNANQPFVDWIWPDIDYALSLDQSFLKTLENESRWLLGQGGPDLTKPRNYLNFIHSAPLSAVSPNAMTLIK